MYGLKSSIRKVLLILSTVIILLSCTFSKIIYHNSTSIEDYKIFSNRTLKASTDPFYFIKDSNRTRVPKEISYRNKTNVSRDDFLESKKTIAFLIIKNDTLLFEKYYNGYSENSLSLSFSMTKSFVSILVGCAIDDGYIKSVEQPVADFVPELEHHGFDKVTIKHLLQMTSGMAYSEHYLFGQQPWFYYGKNLKRKLINLKLKEEPGKRFKYKCGESQLLGLVLMRALKTKTITAYMQEKIWEPIGMEYNGLWSTDQEVDGLEKVYCCISGRARDFAKFGRLYLQKGNWKGKQVVPSNWIEQSTKIDTTAGSPWNYQYQWWLVSKENGDYMAAGHRGQYLYINPEKQLIIVRLGKKKGVNKKKWEEIFTQLSKAIN